MLSIAECRRFVNRTNLKDEEIRELRDELYRLGNVVLDVFIEGGAPDDSTQTEDTQTGVGSSAGEGAL